jgi:proline dehydrogenase
MPLIPKAIIHQVAKKYIAGDELKDAVRMTGVLESIGGMATIDVLGEFVTTKERALHEMEDSMRVLDSIFENKIAANLSVKPTSLGLGIDEDFGYQNVKRVIEKADSYNIFVRIDMENSPYTDKTLNLYRKIRADGFNNTGIVIQAMMRRAMDDIKSLIELKPSIRLCKGIYKESSSIAFQGKEEVRTNYKLLLDYILDNGMYVGVATHDEPLIKYALEAVTKRNLTKDQYEFQMLLGVREEKRNEILRNGHRLRVYVPFGNDWYGYATRRLKENPDMATHIFKAIFIKN